MVKPIFILKGKLIFPFLTQTKNLSTKSKFQEVFLGGITNSILGTARAGRGSERRGPWCRPPSSAPGPPWGNETGGGAVKDPSTGIQTNR